MVTATANEPKAKPETKPPYYPTLETLVGECPPKEGEHVYCVKDATGRSYFVKSNSPSQAALTVCSVARINQKSLIYAMTQAIMNRAVEEGGK